ncbi:MAG: TfoX/Sxy family protein [Burkholderiales bacterium]|nr:TfoX/Sxy family protein [Burkholderiales bacterium]
MATAPNEFVAHCLELLGSVGPARSRRMFGGHGFYVDDLFIALIAYERLYLKVDASTRAAFEAAGCQPFVYDGAGKSVTMAYFTAPEEAMESPPLMQPWARLALAAALRARAAKPPARAPKAQARARKGSAKTAPKKP